MPEDPHGGLAALTADGEIDARTGAVFELPRPARPELPYKSSLKTALLGQARN